MTFFCFCRKKHTVFSHNSFFCCKFVARTYCVNVHKCAEHLQAVCSHTKRRNPICAYILMYARSMGKAAVRSACLHAKDTLHSTKDKQEKRLYG